MFFTDMYMQYNSHRGVTIEYGPMLV